MDVGEHGSRFEYRLTEKGRDLFPVVVALRQWGGDKWNPSPDGQPPLDLRDRDSGQPIQPVTVQNTQGQPPLSIRDVFVPSDEDNPPLDEAQG